MKFTYSDDSIREIKALGRGNYMWDPDEKLWSVHNLSVDRFRAALIGLGYKVADPLERVVVKEKIVEKIVYRDSVPSASDNPWIPLLQIPPANKRREVYKQLAIALHPDHGGDTRLMQLLNSAKDAVRIK